MMQTVQVWMRFLKGTGGRDADHAQALIHVRGLVDSSAGVL